MDDHIHPTLDDYCSFCSLYKKSVSFSSRFGRISHVRIKLPKVEENRFIIFFHYWKWNIPPIFSCQVTITEVVFAVTISYKCYRAVVEVSVLCISYVFPIIIVMIILIDKAERHQIVKSTLL